MSQNKPLSDEGIAVLCDQTLDLDGYNTLHIDDLRGLIRAVELHHGITTEPHDGDDQGDSRLEEILLNDYGYE